MLARFLFLEMLSNPYKHSFCQLNELFSANEYNFSTLRATFLKIHLEMKWVDI